MASIGNACQSRPFGHRLEACLRLVFGANFSHPNAIALGVVDNVAASHVGFTRHCAIFNAPYSHLNEAVIDICSIRLRVEIEHLIMMANFSIAFCLEEKIGHAFKDVNDSRCPFKRYIVEYEIS